MILLLLIFSSPEGDLKTTNESLNKQVQSTYLPPPPPTTTSNTVPLMPPRELEVLRNFPPAAQKGAGAKVLFIHPYTHSLITSRSKQLFRFSAGKTLYPHSGKFFFKFDYFRGSSNTLRPLIDLFDKFTQGKTITVRPLPLCLPVCMYFFLPRSIPG